MSKLFEETEINGMRLSNRFVRSATWEGMATEDGSVTPKLTETNAALAKGGVGLIISSHAYVSQEGQAGPWQLGIYKDELLEGLRKMTSAVHQAGGKIAAQLAHAGCLAAAALSQRTPIVVSYFEGLMNSPGKEMDGTDVRNVVTAFVDAARRAKESGFDAVQLHAAHGYLLNQFLSPAYNRRQDEYGGSLSNRARILLHIFRAIRGAVGNNFPILVKMNCQDFIPNGLSFADSLQAAHLLCQAGIDAVELSGGTFASGTLSPSRLGINSEEKEAYFREEARAFKKQISVPLILVGGLRSLEIAERILDEGIADYISMCRPFVREPGLINRWKSGDRSKATCLSDNQCFKPTFEGKGIYCVVEEREQAKRVEGRN
ncbi:MAG TPA: NADH:flavin oxidoreductase [Syntrophobacteraceae bacterium]|nr:NADH:flavin oxidoreductase [Syntrophobacteraceae bacterium]